jgi:hypothetical protein
MPIPKALPIGMRINLESRLQLIDEEIAALETGEALDRRAKAVLTFGGKPVVEAGAIEATFSAEALQAFQRLVSTTAATREGRKLSTRGRIPDEETYRLFITGTSPGSFSFELEEVANEKQHDPSALHDAVDQTSLLLQATQLDDESYANAVAESNVRVVKALADFLGLMESRGATLRLSVEKRQCLFDTPDVVARAAERTPQDEHHRGRGAGPGRAQRRVREGPALRASGRGERRRDQRTHYVRYRGSFVAQAASMDPMPRAHVDRHRGA